VHRFAAWNLATKPFLRIQVVRDQNAASKLASDHRLGGPMRMVSSCKPKCLSFLLIVLATAGCQKSRSVPIPQQLSAISISVQPDGISIRTPTAKFDFQPNGYLRGYLTINGRDLTLDDPTTKGQDHSDHVRINGKEVSDFELNLSEAKISDVNHRLGPLGKRVEIKGFSKSMPAIEKIVTVEIYDNFPSLALTTTQYKNVGTVPVNLETVTTQRHELNASLVDPAVRPFAMLSFHGSSEKWGKDDVVPISKTFSRANPMEQVMQGDPGTGGGIPVVAFWTGQMGEAIGHLETLPLALSIPVHIASDENVDASIELQPQQTLQPGEIFSTPVSFLSVFHGDFYEPLRMYSDALGAQGWKTSKPNSSDYQANWCGWGYDLKFTSAQMLGTIPKLQELGLKWTTLDAGWFNNRGDWLPRADLGVEGIRKIVDGFHAARMHITLWWIPIVVEDGQGIDILDNRPYKSADVVKEHPDWLMLDKDGKHARMTSGLAGLCPAVPEVQEYYRQLTKRFISDWGFDGHKLDFAYTVPPCYNPKHHHKSPYDSTQAMGEIYKIIFQTTRALKPESVTQSCPCGTPPNMAWLPFIDQAVTADPVGSVQVRRRIKMYKALLGPSAAVYGDHVELTKIAGANSSREQDIGRDFASTVGVGGVPGTKFTYPDYVPKLKNVYLTTEKESVWKKWLGIYNEKMLSQGDFLDLYTYGYDFPEAYAVRKNGQMYYAFFAPDGAPEWSGNLELRGLSPGTYKVTDYENNRDLGTIDGANPALAAKFHEHLLLEVERK
jgi:alpha-galactosidase